MFNSKIISATKPAVDVNAYSFPPVDEFQYIAGSVGNLHDTENDFLYLEAALLSFLAVDFVARDKSDFVTIQNGMDSILDMIELLVYGQDNNTPAYYQVLYKSMQSLDPERLMNCITNTQQIYSQLKKH